MDLHEEFCPKRIREKGAVSDEVNPSKLSKFHVLGSRRFAEGKARPDRLKLKLRVTGFGLRRTVPSHTLMVPHHSVNRSQTGTMRSIRNPLWHLFQEPTPPTSRISPFPTVLIYPGR